MTTNKPVIDLKKILFPTDRLSIGTLRRLHPDLFDESEATAGTFFDDTKPFEDLIILVHLERDLADSIFEYTVNGGIPANDARQRIPLEKLVGVDGKTIKALWQQFGLAAGPHEAAEMLRDLANAASAQARQHVDKPKG